MDQLSLHTCGESVDESQYIRNLISRERLLEAHERAENTDGRITVHITIPVAEVDPLLFLADESISINQPESTFFWQQPTKNCSFVAGPAIESYYPSEENHFTHASEIFNQQEEFDLCDTDTRPKTNIPFWIGGFQFDANKAQEDSIHPSCFILPKWIYFTKNDNGWLRYYAQITPDTDIDNQLEYIVEHTGSLIKNINYLCDHYRDNSAWDEYSSDSNSHILEKTITSKWKNGVESIKAQIEEREIQKLVLARKIDISLPDAPDLVEVLGFLRSEYKNCTTLMMRVNADTAFVASTPERIVSLDNKNISTDSLAGSSSRGAEIVADQKNKYGLLSSEKNLNEHRIVRDDILCQLEGLVNDLSFPRTPEVKQLSNVQHLFTPIEGILKNGSDVFTILSRLHPTPAVGGYPRYNIQEMIKRLERFDRGWYASPVGWVDKDGNSEFVVAIRCGYISGNSAQLFAGCGIVGESNAQKEWDETNLKFMPLLNALKQI